ncbi:hypothetical protein FRC17_006200 [Serendipita sp. 399]|nr:hypothetical protein FRC17_006200 [Serendipita sp. 399]
MHAESTSPPDFEFEAELEEDELASEALNDEAHRWMADFLLYPIWKRSTAARRGTSSEGLTDKEGNHQQEDIQRSSVESFFEQHPEALAAREVQEHPRDSPITACRKSFCDVRLIPRSRDTGRINRFRILVDVFDKGYSKALSDENLESGSNMVTIDTQWMTLFDSGALYLRADENKVYAVPLWNEATELVLPCSPVRGTRLFVSHDDSGFEQNIFIDRELILLHATIVRTWHKTGLAKRLSSDIRWVESLPSVEQQVSVLGNEVFGRILQHRLALM